MGIFPGQQKALKTKGLRLFILQFVIQLFVSAKSPENKGIETSQSQAASHKSASSAKSPEKKGIETMRHERHAVSGRSAKSPENKGIALRIGDAVKHAHRPRPEKEAKKYRIEEMRDWLTAQGIKP